MEWFKKRAESRSRQKPDPKHETMAIEALGNADPTRYSKLTPSKVHNAGWTEDSDYRIVADDEGNEYVDVTRKQILGFEETAPTELVISRLLKGILNVSDVIPTTKKRLFLGPKKRYLSRVMPLEKIEEQTTDDEVVADVVLLTLIFGDGDHTPSSEHNSRTENGRTAYYDFGMASPVVGTKLIPNLLEINTPEALAIFRRKLQLLKERFEGDEGYQFFKAVIESSGSPPHALFWSLPAKKYGDVRSLYNYFVHRIQLVLDAAEERSNTLT
jgi:hypothetical protein